MTISPRRAQAAAHAEQMEDARKDALHAVERWQAITKERDVLQSRLLAMEEVVKAARAASHALRSYQYGNASPDLAEDVANKLDSDLVALDALPKETDAT